MIKIPTFSHANQVTTKKNESELLMNFEDRDPQQELLRLKTHSMV